MLSSFFKANGGNLSWRAWHSCLQLADEKRHTRPGVRAGHDGCVARPHPQLSRGGEAQTALRAGREDGPQASSHCVPTPSPSSVFLRFYVEGRCWIPTRRSKKYIYKMRKKKSVHRFFFSSRYRLIQLGYGTSKPASQIKKKNGGASRELREREEKDTPTRRESWVMNL